MRVVIVLALLARAAHAQDEFEIQVYDVETAARGEPGVELHVNAHSITDAPDQLHVTLEPHYGLAAWLELGAYLQSATTATGEVLFAGAKLRAKARRPGRLWRDRVGLAINVELSYVPARFEPNVYGSEVRPIVDLAIGRLYAAVNPIVSIDLGGARAGTPDFEPAAKLGVRASRAVMLGAEGYAAFAATTSARAYAVVDASGAWWDVNVGVGWAWGTSDRAVAKIIFGVHPRR